MESVINAVDAPESPRTQETAGLSEQDVMLLIGLAYGPKLQGLDDLPIGVLEIAQRISVAIGNAGLAERCKDLANEIRRHMPAPAVSG